MADTKDGPELHPTTLELAQGKNFAAISSLLPSGQIQTQYIWVAVSDDGRLYVNTETHRAKYKNVERDPRVTLAIRDEADPYRYAEVRAGSRRPAPGPRPAPTSTRWDTSTSGPTTRRRTSRASG